MSEISSTDAARNFADILDAIEHRGESFTVIRRGRAVAHLEPVRAGRGADMKDLLRMHRPDPDWSCDLDESRDFVRLQHRQ